MHRPAHGRCITPQDRETLRRCGGVDGRANVGHMPGSCLCASVRALLPGSHVQGLQGFPCKVFFLMVTSLPAQKRRLRAEEAKDGTHFMRSGR